MPHFFVDLEILRRDAAAYAREVKEKAERRAEHINKIGFDAWMRQRIDRAHAEYMAGHAAGGIAYGH